MNPADEFVTDFLFKVLYRSYQPRHLYIPD